MRTEPILSLAFSIHANKGAYALLLGSGVSRSAKILTGWEITRDLVRKMARMKGENCEPDPEAWYRDLTGEDADYSKILAVVGKTPADRAAILKSYFEPTEEERVRGEKLPTEAHRRVAELVSRGYVRVIVTTNFDHLIEDSLRACGIEPVIISTPDSAQGAPPLSHTTTLIVKANGDYLDARIKNTPDELARYDEGMNQILDRIFDEFGLVVCGWSADWDVAMREALRRCKSHRLATYWAEKDPLSETTKRLTESRRAEVVEIDGADSFFKDLAEKVLALEEVGKPHPLETKVAVGTLERYLDEPHCEIRVHNLVRRATEQLCKNLTEERYPLTGALFNAEEVKKRLRRYEADLEVLVNLMITGCYWGRAQYDKLWAECLERVANPPPLKPGPFNAGWLSLRKYPALLVMYGAGAAAVARENYRTLHELLTSPKAREGESRGERAELLLAVNIGTVTDGQPENIAREVFGASGWVGLPHYLNKVLHHSFGPLVPQDYDYHNYFDRFEYLLALAYADLAGASGRSGWIPLGRQWRGKMQVIDQLDREAAAAGDKWFPLKAGFFGGSFDAFIKAQSMVRQLQNRVRIW